MAQITDQGFKGKTLLEYKEQIEDAHREIDPNWDISPTSYDGLQIAILSEMFHNLDMLVGLAYAACDPSTAMGQSLVNICDISGVDRTEGRFSTAIVQFTGATGTRIARTTEIQSETNGTVWTTNEEIVLGEDANFNEVEVTCKTEGPEQSSAGDLNKLVVPINGVTAVTNPNAAIHGQFEETINALRIKRQRTVARQGSNQVDNMKSALLLAEQVRHCKVLENFEGEVDDKGLNPHSLMIIVDGGSNDTVAATIASKKNPGCNMNAGNDVIPNRVEQASQTPGGSPINITFYRAKIIRPTVIVTLNRKASLPVNYEQEIQQEIVQFSKGSIFENENVAGFDRTGYDIGEVVTAFGLTVPIAKVLGSTADVQSVDLQYDGQTNRPSIEPEFNEIVIFETPYIKVELSEE